LGYLNKHEGATLLEFAEQFSELGIIKAKKNGWSGGSYLLEAASIVNINTEYMELNVTVQERSKPKRFETVKIDLGKMLLFVLLVFFIRRLSSSLSSSKRSLSTELNSYF